MKYCRQLDLGYTVTLLGSYILSSSTCLQYLILHGSPNILLLHKGLSE